MTPSKSEEKYPESTADVPGSYPTPSKKGNPEGHYPEATPSKSQDGYPVKSSGSAYPVVPEKHVPEGEGYKTVASTLTQYVTLTKVHVPYKTSAPYGAANSTIVGYPPAGTASNTGKPSKPTSYTPAEFKGAASRFSVGMSGLVVLIAGLLVL